MGEALLSRLLSQGLYTPDEVLLGEPSPERRQVLSEQHSIQTSAMNREVIEASRVILLAVKPQIFEHVAKDFVGAHSEAPPLIISILAGITLAKLEAAVPNSPVIRAMPNTPSTVGAGMTAIALGSKAGSEHGELAIELFSAVGEVVQVAEGMMDAVTGLSGSGPGYVSIVIEASGGWRCGGGIAPGNC